MGVDQEHFIKFENRKAENLVLLHILSGGIFSIFITKTDSMLTDTADFNSVQCAESAGISHTMLYW